jgi:hypothetical protein
MRNVAAARFFSDANNSSTQSDPNKECAITVGEPLPEQPVTNRNFELRGFRAYPPVPNKSRNQVCKLNFSEASRNVSNWHADAADFRLARSATGCDGSVRLRFGFGVDLGRLDGLDFLVHLDAASMAPPRKPLGAS